MAEERDNTGLVAPPDAEDILRTDAERRRKLETDLARMGMSPDEVRRLMNADAHTAKMDIEPERAAVAMPTQRRIPTLQAAPKPAANTNRTGVSDLEAYAAQLTKKVDTERIEAIAQATASLEFPPFREATIQETLQAETILRDANMLRRRERYAEALEKCLAAIRLTPKDAAALELLGDILQGVARTDEALAAYKRATQADQKRYSAEKKYGDLLMRQRNWDVPDAEAARGQNSWLAVLLSAFCPGAGQIYLGDIPKGIFFIVMFAACLGILSLVPPSKGHIGTARAFLYIFTGIVYLGSLIDTNIQARKR